MKFRAVIFDLDGTLADSLLDFDGNSYGKPASEQAAADLWRRVSGRAATLFTGQCLIDTATGQRARGVASTVVRFGRPDEVELAAYVASGEPLLTAGGFTIDGRAAPFIEGIDGNHGTVIGLSLPLLRRMLADLGVPITSLWRMGGPQYALYEAGTGSGRPEPG